MRRDRLDDTEVSSWLSAHPTWHHVDQRLVTSLRFDGFEAAFAFMAAVAVHAEALDHHPDWSNSYDRVDIALTTHDRGGLTSFDLALAERIDGCAEAAGAQSVPPRSGVAR